MHPQGTTFTFIHKMSVAHPPSYINVSRTSTFIHKCRSHLRVHRHGRGRSQLADVVAGLPVSCSGLPTWLQGLPVSCQACRRRLPGWPTWLQGLPVSCSGLPTWLQGLPVSLLRLAGVGCKACRCRLQGLPTWLQGLPVSCSGLPTWLQGLPVSCSGLPTWLQGLPVSCSGLPTWLQGLPVSCSGLPTWLQGLRRTNVPSVYGVLCSGGDGHKLPGIPDARAPPPARLGALSPGRTVNVNLASDG